MKTIKISSPFSFAKSDISFDLINDFAASGLDLSGLALFPWTLIEVLPRELLFNSKYQHPEEYYNSPNLSLTYLGLRHINVAS